MDANSSTLNLKISENPILKYQNEIIFKNTLAQRKSWLLGINFNKIIDPDGAVATSSAIGLVESQLQ